VQENGIAAPRQGQCEGFTEVVGCTSNKGKRLSIHANVLP